MISDAKRRGNSLLSGAFTRRPILPPWFRFDVLSPMNICREDAPASNASYVPGTAIDITFTPTFWNYYLLGKFPAPVWVGNFSGLPNCAVSSHIGRFTGLTGNSQLKREVIVLAGFILADFDQATVTYATLPSTTLARFENKEGGLNLASNLTSWTYSETFTISSGHGSDRILGSHLVAGWRQVFGLYVQFVAAQGAPGWTLRMQNEGVTDVHLLAPSL